MREDAPQYTHAMRDLPYVVWTGCRWRHLRRDIPPWEVVYWQARHWAAAKEFEEAPGISPRSCGNSKAGGDGANKIKMRAKVHSAVGTLGHLHGLSLTATNEPERAEVAELAEKV